MDLNLIFIGTGGSAPTARRGLPATLIRRGGEHILVDCGEGTQRQLMKSTGLVEIDLILVTHLHADHWLGLPGMLKTFDLREREAPLTIAGPVGIVNAIEGMWDLGGGVSYEVDLVELKPNDKLEYDGWAVHAIDADHRCRALSYALIEDDRPGRFDAALAKELGIDDPRNFGRLQRGETVDGVKPSDVMGEARRGRKIVLSGDTRPTDELVLAAYEADLLIHEATFMDEMHDRATKTGHSTTIQAAEVALDAKVKMLAMVHLSSRHKPSEAVAEAREVFDQAILPRDFDLVRVPFPEKGIPVHVQRGGRYGFDGELQGGSESSQQQ